MSHQSQAALGFFRGKVFLYALVLLDCNHIYAYLEQQVCATIPNFY
jgi:hypothetical protein